MAAHGTRMHLLSAVRHGSGMLLKQLRVADKRNEVSALPQLWKGLDLHHSVSTFDALFTQRAVAQEIVRRGGHYLMVVKGNQATLHEALQTLFAAPPWPQGEEERESFRSVNSGHGRLEQRTLVSSTLLNEYLNWPGLGQVLQRTCQRPWPPCGTAYSAPCAIRGGRASRKPCATAGPLSNALCRSSAPCPRRPLRRGSLLCSFHLLSLDFDRALGNG